MKKAVLKFSLAIILIVALIPTSILAQHKEVHVIMNTEGNAVSDSSYISFWSTMFNVDDIEQMHNKLDSIFSELDENLSKRIKVMAFNADSLSADFDFDFHTSVDSVFAIQKLITNDKRIDALIKSHVGPDGLNKIIVEQDGTNRIKHFPHEGMNIEVVCDSVIKDGKKIITKEVIVISDDSLKTKNSPVVVKKYKDANGNDKEVVIAYSHQEGFKKPDKHIKIEKANKHIKSGSIVGKKKHVSIIGIADAEILVKGGIPAKVITAPALQPEKVGVNIKVEEKFGNKVKSIGLSVDFADVAPIHVLVLDKNGGKVFEEKEKNFTGTYKYNIELNEALEPYYFLIIRDKKLFGRMLQN